ncbi:hypothetical protein [Mycolicibacterium mengxianglii]|uniref:hypothetical protein n=1 Tax=Mycolicibacterium mengxianglii TaxID=2736649 RepID=UPI001E2C1906|nr:hypothetical protein [Mycolicibacterium mengxianglii]
MAEIDPADVVTLTTEGAGNQQAIADIAVPLITTLARAYTRGRGFLENGRPNDELAAVITTAAARFVANPKQASGSKTVGPFIIDQRTRGFEGWSLAELAVLNRYRVRAM